MTKKMFVGGRGVKAPYNTTVVRVPDPLVPIVEKMLERYRAKILDGTSSENQTLVDVILESLADFKIDNYLIGHAKDILKKRGTRKSAMAKLLQVIFGRSIKEEDLDE